MDNSYKEKELGSIASETLGSVQMASSSSRRNPRKTAHESLNEHILVCKTGRVLKKLFLSLDMEEIYNHFKSGDSSPIIICQGVSVQAAQNQSYKLL